MMATLAGTSLLVQCWCEMYLEVVPPNVGVQNTQESQNGCPAAYGTDDLCLSFPVGMNPLNEMWEAVAERPCSRTISL